MYVRANHCHKGNRLPQDGLAWTSGGDAQQAAHEVEDIVGLLAPELLQVTLAISLRRVVLCEHRALELDLSQHARDGVEHNWVDASREDGPTAAVSKTQLAGMCMLVNELDSGLEDVEILRPKLQRVFEWSGRAANACACVACICARECVRASTFVNE